MGPFLAICGAACGLLASPGEYASGSGSPDADPDASVNGVETGAPDSGPTPSGGTLAILSGERNPSSPADTPAWTSDLWLANLDADGRVTGFAIGKSAPVVGSFDAVGISGGKIFTLSFGFGIGGDTGNALQTLGWGPGPVGEWTASGAGMPGGLADSTRTFFGTYALVLGGTRQVTEDGGTITTYQNETHLADVNLAMGTLGATRSAGRTLGVSRSRASAIVTGGRVYVIGGKIGFTPITNSVEMASVDETAGTLGTFSAQPAMQVNAADHRVFLAGVAAQDGWLYVAGGRTNNANAPSAVVLVAKIDAATGILSNWKSAGALPQPLRDFAFVGRQGRLYVAGGIMASGSRTDEVLSARIQPDGTLSAWDANNAKLPSPRSDSVAVSY